MAGFVGAVVDPVDDERSSLYGACFAIDTRHFVTADHVVTAGAERGARRLHVIGLGMWPTPVEAVFRHPTFDVAVLRVAHDVDVQPFWPAPRPLVGDVVDLAALKGATRLELRTTVTGFGRCVPRAPYSFAAIELADAPGRAFSGAPVIGADGGVVGVLTQTASGGELGDEQRGIALLLEPCLSWLTETIQPQERCAA